MGRGTRSMETAIEEEGHDHTGHDERDEYGWGALKGLRMGL